MVYHSVPKNVPDSPAAKPHVDVFVATMSIATAKPPLSNVIRVSLLCDALQNVYRTTNLINSKITIDKETPKLIE